MSTAEHPLTLAPATANVRDVSDKISQESFGGSRVRLLNVKNLPIYDMDGSRGKNSDLESYMAF